MPRGPGNDNKCSIGADGLRPFSGLRAGKDGRLRATQRLCVCVEGGIEREARTEIAELLGGEACLHWVDAKTGVVLPRADSGTLSDPNQVVAGLEPKTVVQSPYGAILATYRYSARTGRIVSLALLIFLG